MQQYNTEQEQFWSGSFGDDYIDRNNSDTLFMHKVAFWARMLHAANEVSSVLELGCNIGLNLMAVRRLNPDIEVSGYEINEAAAEQARKNTDGNITCGTIIEELDCDNVDLTFTTGVLIHINPDELVNVYKNLYEKSNRFILVAEYYNPSPVTVPYRGHSDRLFKRDFAGEMMDQYDLKLVDYGFTYKRDNWAPQDDITWFLLEK